MDDIMQNTDDNLPKEEDLKVEPVTLKPRAIFGINGKVPFGLHLHPNKKEIIFPLGNKIGIADIKTDKQQYLAGHTHTVSCICISSSGTYLASGQSNYLGFQAYVLVWDYKERKQFAKHDLHKSLVQAICFTYQDRYVVSIGGDEDDSVIVFDMDSKSPICRSVASRSISGGARAVAGFTNSSEHFIVAGDRHLRVWAIEREKRKLHVHDVSCGKHQRIYTCMKIDAQNREVYLGSMTGDIVKVVVNMDGSGVSDGFQGKTAMLGAFGVFCSRKVNGVDCCRYVNGIREIFLFENGQLLVTSGDGTVELIEERPKISLAHFKENKNPTWPIYRSVKKGKVTGAITSLVRINDNSFYFCTEMNEIYSLDIKTFNMKLLKTCHRNEVTAIVFPNNLSSVFATAGFESIRIWSTKRLQELLRIIVYNFECTGIVFSFDGTALMSAWDDGVIRSFTPITGRLIFAIPNAHNKGCSAITISSNGRLLVSGGVEGQVRLWKVEPLRQSLVAVLKDHSGPVSSLQFNHLDTEVISASYDGSCVIWDIKRMVRKLVIAANTQFTEARFFPSSVQVLTCGTDGVVSYWMAFNGNLLREIPASAKSPINSLSINRSGEYFITVGADQYVKLWEYNRGMVMAQANDHASQITTCSYSPCGKFFVTGSKDGTIIIWDTPAEFVGSGIPPAEPVIPKSAKGAKEVEAKVISSSKVATPKQEHIEELVSKTSKGDICCVECPPVDKKKVPQVECDYVADVKKC